MAHRKISVQVITLYCFVGAIYYFTQLLSLTKGRVMTMTKSHISKVKVTLHA